MNESQAVTYKTLVKDASYGEAGPDERTIAAHGEIVHTDSFHRCWQGHRASWPVGVGIVESTLYPDSG